EGTPCERAGAAGDPTVEIGLGEHHFEAPIDDFDRVTMVHGPQGGTHLWLAVRTSGVNPGERHPLGADADVPVIEATLTAEDDGGVVGSGSWAFEALHGDAAQAELALGEFVIEAHAGTAVVLDLGIEDACGRAATDEVSFVVK
ncbi:MAG: hypothetical protein ABMB14_32485, partial [Myxococcota bacterium]